MGTNLLWTGLTLIVALNQIPTGLPLDLVGAVIMLIGLVMLWLGR